LEKTTLKSLGLNSGKAILRLIYRDPEQLRTQAHVSTPLLPKPAITAVNDLSKPSNKDHHQTIASSVVPHCSKNKTGDINLSKMNMENPEKCKTKVKLHGKNKTADALRDKDQERITNTRAESHPIASSRHDSERDERVTEMRCTGIQEDAYGIKFVRCNCAARAVSSERCVCLSTIFRVTVRGKERSAIQSGRDFGIAEGRVTGQLFRSRFTRREDSHARR